MQIKYQQFFTNSCEMIWSCCSCKMWSQRFLKIVCAVLLPTTWHVTLWQLHALAKRSVCSHAPVQWTFALLWQAAYQSREAGLHTAASSTILECFGTLSFLESLLIFGCRIGPIGRTYWELSLRKDTVSRACILEPCHSTPNTYLSTCGFNCWKRFWPWWLRKCEARIRRIKPMLRQSQICFQKFHGHRLCDWIRTWRRKICCLAALRQGLIWCTKRSTSIVFENDPGFTTQGAWHCLADGRWEPSRQHKWVEKDRKTIPKNGCEGDTLDSSLPSSSFSSSSSACFMDSNIVG